MTLSLQTGRIVKLQLKSSVILETASLMLILIMIGAHRGLKAASKVMAMVDSISTKVLEGTQLEMTKFFVSNKIKVKKINYIYFIFTSHV